MRLDRGIKSIVFPSINRSTTLDNVPPKKKEREIFRVTSFGSIRPWQSKKIKRTRQKNTDKLSVWNDFGNSENSPKAIP